MLVFLRSLDAADPTLILLKLRSRIARNLILGMLCGCAPSRTVSESTTVDEEVPETESEDDGVESETESCDCNESSSPSSIYSEEEDEVATLKRQGQGIV